MARRPSYALRAALFAASAALCACKPKPKEDTVGAAPAPAPPPASAPASAAPATAQDSGAPRGGGDPAPAPAPPPHLHPTIIGAPNVAIGEVVGSASYVGQRVHVTGRCLGYSNPTTLGPPPLTRSDWQLGSAGATIFVSGPLPGGCSATEGSATPVTILARVAQDTLPSLGKSPGAARRYLVLIRE